MVHTTVFSRSFKFTSIKYNYNLNAHVYCVVRMWVTSSSSSTTLITQNHSIFVNYIRLLFFSILNNFIVQSNRLFQLFLFDLYALDNVYVNATHTECHVCLIVCIPMIVCVDSDFDREVAFAQFCWLIVCAHRFVDCLPGLSLNHDKCSNKLKIYCVSQRSRRNLANFSILSIKLKCMFVYRKLC